MWTLIIVIGMAGNPLFFDGYTSKRWCEEHKAEFVQALPEGTVAGLCLKLPPLDQTD